jgi:radical SAM protein with 4Fe4S-binding SPASM domain
VAQKAKLIQSMSYDELSKLPARNLQNCDAGFGMAAVRSDGKITPCYTITDYVIGDIFADNITDVWQNSEKLRIFREMHDVSLDSVEKCKDCLFKGLCNGGCRAGAYYASGKKRLDTFDPEACFAYLKKEEIKN